MEDLATRVEMYEATRATTNMLLEESYKVCDFYKAGLLFSYVENEDVRKAVRRYITVYTDANFETLIRFMWYVERTRLQTHSVLAKLMHKYCCDGNFYHVIAAFVVMEQLLKQDFRNAVGWRSDPIIMATVGRTLGFIEDLFEQVVTGWINNAGGWNKVVTEFDNANPAICTDLIVEMCEFGMLM